MNFILVYHPHKNIVSHHLDTKHRMINQSDNDFNKNRTHQAEIPAANGITNARSLARLYAALIGDVEDNKYKRILTEDILKQATKSNTPENEIDFVLHVPTQFAMGFMLWDQIFPSLGPGVFGHSGNFRYYITSLLIYFFWL